MYDIKQIDAARWQSNYSKPNPNGNDHCIVCGKIVSNPKHFIRLFWGSTAVIEVEANEIIAAEGDGGDLLYYPVGSDCLKHQPELKPYVEDAARVNARVTAELESKIEINGWGKISRIRPSDVDDDVDDTIYTDTANKIIAMESQQVAQVSSQIDDINAIIDTLEDFNTEAVTKNIDNIINEPDAEKRHQLFKERQESVDRTNLKILMSLKSLAAHSGKDTSKIDALINSIQETSLPND